ncbi:DsbA family protein [Halomonas sp. MCCC 1A11036]|jgi:putative protein-disulfide isomerase|uniref:DsbA family protein n=2 Tax=Billgrantia TaxID=3137761 RepID=A0A6I6SSC6_9GAMM|nr:MULTISPECIES: DsbA family protein [Halomonas]MCE8022048.1 DsbA family protein [Halomonas zhangzhouensis]MCE8035492.1 DsbA family protein [Halomonas sp. MCCC 1A11057]MDX5433347.1 DsbA family protein [Halomonas sp.]QHC51624.1 DsbA family protein [Halomonas tianxiuensis]
MTAPTRLIYLFDPQCGWCYGAAVVMERLLERAEHDVQLVPTGLFAGEGAFAMNDGFAAHAWAADQRIARLTGQPFSDAYRDGVLGNREWRVDSGPATLALTAVRLTEPTREFAALHALQRARYVEGRNNADPAIVASVLESLDLADAARRFHAQDDELITSNQARIAEGKAWMRRVGANGVPTLVVSDEKGARVVNSSALYGDVDTLESALKVNV